MRKSNLAYIVAFLALVNALLLGVYFFLEKKGADLSLSLGWKGKEQKVDIASGSSCRHLPSQYCDQGRWVKVKGYEGASFWALAYRLPAGTPLFSPVQGVLFRSFDFLPPKDGDEKQPYVFIRTAFKEEKNEEGIIVRSTVTREIIFLFDTLHKEGFDPVKPGDKIAELTTRPVYKDYNLLVVVLPLDKEVKDNRALIKEYLFGQAKER